MSEAKKEWYVVNTYAGHENRVKENLERRVETMGLQDFLFQIIVAEEKEIEYKNGKEVEKTKNLFSGGGAKPFPVAEEEMENILRRLGKTQREVQVDFEVKDRVRILNGAFKGSEGTVEELDPTRQVATVLLVLFGRETPTEIPYSDLEKIEL